MGAAAHTEMYAFLRTAVDEPEDQEDQGMSRSPAVARRRSARYLLRFFLTGLRILTLLSSLSGSHSYPAVPCSQ
jgi:hypothetical protein